MEDEKNQKKYHDTKIYKQKLSGCDRKEPQKLPSIGDKNLTLAKHEGEWKHCWLEVVCQILAPGMPDTLLSFPG